MATETTTPAATQMREAFDAIAARDLDRLTALWDDATTDVFHALGETVTGETALREFFAEFFAAVPDLSFTTEAVHPVADDIAVGQWHMTGTFSGGPFQGIEATGRPVDLHGIDVMTFDGDVLRHNDVYYDGLTFARQIGMLPAADSTGDRAMLAAFNAATKARRAVREQLGR